MVPGGNEGLVPCGQSLGRLAESFRVGVPEIAGTNKGHASDLAGVEQFAKGVGVVLVESQRGDSQGVDTVGGRNDPCPCGSGKKYKKCCMKE